MQALLKQIEQLGIIPVVKIEQAEKAVSLAAALQAGGLPAAEITFRTAGAAQALAAITSAYPQMLVGAGTVLSVEQAGQAIAAGAKFIVSPGLNPDVVRYVKAQGILMLPGCSTPSEVEQALALGLDTVKFFPAQAAGGLAMIRAMSAPYGKVRFMPTGGVSAENVRDYLDCPAVLACGGSWMVAEKLIQAGQFAEITRLSEQAVAAVLAIRLAASGYYRQPEEAPDIWQKLLSAPPVSPEQAACFSGRVEFAASDLAAKSQSAGYLVLSTADLPRARSYLARQGIDEARECVFAGRKRIQLDTQVNGLDLYLQQA